MLTTESILLATTRLRIFRQQQLLTCASAFFFESGGRLFLVTSRHVIIDEPSGHRPDRIDIALHNDARNMAELTDWPIPLYRDGKAVWHQGSDSNGNIDIVAIELERAALPATMVYRAFTPLHLPAAREQITVGVLLLIVGFPRELHDDIHRLPVARHGVIASSFGLRNRSTGYFLTDARMHRDTSGAAVIARVADPPPALGDLPWMLLGVHSSWTGTMSPPREPDKALGLNRAWYADVLMPPAAGGS